MPSESPRTRRGARSIKRIVEAAARLFGRQGFDGASMYAVAKAAGVSKGLLHYHFDSKEHLLLEAVRTTFHAIADRFEDRFERGERGLDTSLDALDALWGALRDMHKLQPFLVETFAIASQRGALQSDVHDLVQESTELLERGVEGVFAGQRERIVVPPERLARIVRVTVLGLIVELALARTEEERTRLDATYRDLRDLYARVALTGAGSDPA